MVLLIFILTVSALHAVFLLLAWELLVIELFMHVMTFTCGWHATFHAVCTAQVILLLIFVSQYVMRMEYVLLVLPLVEHLIGHTE